LTGHDAALLSESGMLAISTIWNGHRHTDGEALFSELRTLGISDIEAGPGTRICLFPGFRRVLKTGRARVISVANFAPKPIDPRGSGESHCELTAIDTALRKQALHWTKITIDYAAGLEAPFVVIRLGRSRIGAVTPTLLRLVEQGELHSRPFVTAKLRAIRERERESGAWLNRARASLEELLPHAKARNVRLAIVSQGDYEDGPTDRELLVLLKDLGKDGSLGYWHDFSETQQKANLGFLDHAEWLREVRPHLLGCHVNDLRWPGDTQLVPLSGLVDFERLMPLLPRDIPLVWHVSPRCRAADLRQMFPLWEEKFVRASSRGRGGRATSAEG
jgi:sugar phosphate isomerase/epimerase